ncbi:MAG: hypothetical protein ACRED2_12070, partial [Methylocella sp.]
MPDWFAAAWGDNEYGPTQQQRGQAAMSNIQQDLARRVLHGAAYLSLRQILGLGLSVASIVIMARLVGPTAYGTYVIAAGIFTVLSG